MERAVRISEGSLRLVAPSAWVREDARKHWGLSLTYEHIEGPPPPPHAPVHPVDGRITTLCITTCQPPKKMSSVTLASEGLGRVAPAHLGVVGD